MAKFTYGWAAFVIAKRPRIHDDELAEYIGLTCTRITDIKEELAAMDEIAKANKEVGTWDEETSTEHLELLHRAAFVLWRMQLLVRAARCGLIVYRDQIHDLNLIL